MSNRISVNNSMLLWAIERAGIEFYTFAEKYPNIIKWLQGEKQPTVKQLEDFSRKVHIPFGYLFLSEPPMEQLPIHYFRSEGDSGARLNINIYDTILLLQQRQDWLKEYLTEEGFKPLPFVGKFQKSQNIAEIVYDIRETLNLEENWASYSNNWQDALNYLVEIIESKGIITVFNGVFENNAYRKIPVDECRGFVLVDEIAPFMFINNADWKSSQMFTIVHELAHIWTGYSAGFDFRDLQPANNSVEILCNKVAAEFLVPEAAFNDAWLRNPDFKALSKFFKVSEIVIARRALDTGKLSRTEFFEFYKEYSQREFAKKEKQGSGGSFYDTTKKRLSITFAAHIKQAVKSGKLLYRDAYKLTSLYGDTFHNFFSNHM